MLWQNNGKFKEKNKSQTSFTEPTFVSQKIFNKKFVAIHEIKPVLTLYKPIYVGFSILDLSKFFMYEFHSRYINKNI